MSLVYTGSLRAGVAGAGWEVPLWYVHRTSSSRHRKPLADGSNAAAERLYVSLGGGPQLMVPHNGAYVPFMGSEYSELRAEGDTWKLRTLDNTEYTFSPINGSFWVLTEIRKASTSDRVVVTYNTASGCVGKSELNVKTIEYGFDVAGENPLYNIDLNYGQWEPTGCSGFDTFTEGSINRYRIQVLEEIFVDARNNQNPSQSHRIRAYDLVYAGELDTRKPQLTEVWKEGEQGTDAPRLPVAKYFYGALTHPSSAVQSGRAIKFGPWEEVPRPWILGSVADFEDHIATSEVDRYDVQSTTPGFAWASARVETNRARHLMRDFTGDGVPDLLFRNGDTWHLFPARLAVDGVGFGGVWTSWTTSTGPSEINVQSTFRFSESSAAAELAFRQAMITTETWNDFVDWNGDGRLDVIDVKGGQDADHWKIWLNDPSASGGVTWRAVQIEIGSVRNELATRGLQRDDFSDLFPTLDWSDRLPIERSRSWPRVDRHVCAIYDCREDSDGGQSSEWECTPESSCPQDPDRARTVGVDTITEWQIADINEDGFPDVAANEQAVRYCEADDRWSNVANVDGCQHTVPWDPFANEFVCSRKHHEWITLRGSCNPAEPAGDMGASYFLNRTGPYTGISLYPFSSTAHPVVGNSHGLTRWTTGADDSINVNLDVAYAGDDGTSWQSGALVDSASTGTLRGQWSQYLVDAVPSVVQTDRHLVCDDDSLPTDNVTAWQGRTFTDLNGDGLADRILGGVAFNTGARADNGALYGPTRDIELPGGANEWISRSEGTCAGDMHAVSGITDMDGDGKAELLRIDAGHLYMSRLLPGDETENIHGVGRLLAIDNGYGVRTSITYDNVKADRGVHAVPFPEIAVRRVEVSSVHTKEPLAPTYFAYGGARLQYDPLAGRWVFAGYERQAALRGRSTEEETLVDGVLTLTERAPAAVPGATYVDHATAHRPTCHGQLEGAFYVDEFDAYLEGSCYGGFAESRSTSSAQLVEPSVAVSSLESLECSDLDPGTGQPFGYGRCRSAGVVYSRSVESWEGNAAPPSLANVLSGSSVEAVDMYGRPRRTHDKGDLRRDDDDVCTEVTYAVPAAGGPFPSVPSSVELTDCGYGNVDEGAPPGPPEVISGSQLEYDDLPNGHVSQGQLTKRSVDVYDDTGFVGSHALESLAYDQSGEVSVVSRSRSTGTASSVTSMIERDAYGFVYNTFVQASDVAPEFAYMASTSTWPSLGASSFDEAGVGTFQDFDGHGRLIRERPRGLDGTETTLRTIQYASDGRSVTVDTFPDYVSPGDEQAASVRTRATLWLDDYLRPSFIETELGQDYAGSSMVSELAEYDDFGRRVFTAAPFQNPSPPFTPKSVERPLFGMTAVFDRRSRVVRTVATAGRDELSVQSSVGDDTYVTQFQYGYEDGAALTLRMGPDETDPQSPRVLHWDELWRDARGRETERSRFDASGERLDLVRQEWDRLGRVVGIHRYVDPVTGNVPVSWNSRFDSLGQLLSITEPGMATRFNKYDEMGNAIEFWWTDGVERHVTTMQYDSFGRLRERKILDENSVGVEVQSHDLYHYDEQSESPDQPPGYYNGRLAWSESTNVGAIFQGYDEFGRGNSTTYRYSKPSGIQRVRESAVYSPGGRLNSFDLETETTLDQFSYNYDSAGRTIEVRDQAAQTSLWLAQAVDFDGHVGQVALGNGVVESFARAPDGLREPTEWIAATQSGTYSYENEKFDAAGRVIQESFDGPGPWGHYSRGYDFDSLGRLTTSIQVDGGIPGVESYTHDGVGNLLSRTTNNGTGDRFYEPDTVDPDRLCRFALTNTSGPCDFTYDGLGNVSEDLTYGPMFARAFKYDAAGRLTSTTKGSHGAAFTYGPRGRVHTQIDGWDDRETWTFGGLVEENTRGADTYVERRIVGPQGLIASRRYDGNDHRTLYVHGDGRANRFFTNEVGEVVHAADYTTYGLASRAGGWGYLESSDDLWNGGDDIPELGVVLLGPRAYDPDLGRFLQRDPIAITSRATTANPYAFSFSDPINYADPSGLSPTWFGEAVSAWVHSTQTPGGVISGNAGVAGGKVLFGPTGGSVADDALRVARFAWDNSVFNPEFNYNVARGALDELKSIADYNTKIFRTCGLMVWCAPTVIGRDVVNGVRAIDLSSISAPNLGDIANAACPNGQCADAVGHALPGMVGGGAGKAAGAADDVVRGVARTGANVADDVARGAGPNSIVYQLVDEAGDAVYYGKTRTDQLINTVTRHSFDPPGPWRGLQVISREVAEHQALALETELIQAARAEGRIVYNTADRSISVARAEGIAVPRTKHPFLSLLNRALYEAQ